MSRGPSFFTQEWEDQSYRLLFENSPQPMWLYDYETLAFLAVNDAAIFHYGYSRAEFLSMTIKDIRDPADIPDLIRATTGVFGMILRESRIWRHRKKDGTFILVEIAANDHIWNGRRARLVLVTDVTARVQTESKLLESERRQEAAIRASAQILFDWDLKSNDIAYAGSLQEKLGYAAFELSGGITRFTELVHSEDRVAFQKEVERVLDTHDPLSFEFRVQKKDGGYLYFDSQGHFIQDENGNWRLIGFLTDVTSRRLLEAQFIQAQKMEAVGHLAGGVAHDFNNILGVILGYTALLEAQPLSPRTFEYVAEIDQAAKRAAVLTRQLLAFGRKQVLDLRVLNLNSVLEGLEAMLRRLSTKDIELVFFKSPELGNVRLDQTQMEQVIMNLVINARDATPKGGKITVETTNVVLDSEYCRLHPGVKPGPYVMLTVSDTGTGMDSVTLSRVFEPFFTTKNRDRGTGLGLAMVHGTVRQSGGHIWVYSEPGEGAVFKLYFPRVDEQVEPAVEETPQKNLAGSETVLVTEDEESYRKLVVRLLQEQGYKLLSASNGADALEVARNFPGVIHLLLTDAVLPKLDGRKLAEELAKTRPTIKVLYMSGYTSNVVVHHGMLDPGIEFLHKPFTRNRLLGKMRALLDSD